MSSKYALMNIIATKVYESEEEINNKNRYNTKLIVHIYQVNRINNNCKVKRKKINIILKWCRKTTMCYKLSILKMIILHHKKNKGNKWYTTHKDSSGHPAKKWRRYQHGKDKASKERCLSSTIKGKQ